MATGPVNRERTND